MLGGCIHVQNKVRTQRPALFQGSCTDHRYYVLNWTPEWKPWKPHSSGPTGRYPLGGSVSQRHEQHLSSAVWKLITTHTFQRAENCQGSCDSPPLASTTLFVTGQEFTGSASSTTVWARVYHLSASSLIMRISLQNEDGLKSTSFPATGSVTHGPNIGPLGCGHQQAPGQLGCSSLILQPIRHRKRTELL